MCVCDSSVRTFNRACCLLECFGRLSNFLPAREESKLKGWQWKLFLRGAVAALNGHSLVRGDDI